MTPASLPRMVSREEWMTARLELPTQGKELTRARDRVNAKRRRLLMIRVEKDYGYPNWVYRSIGRPVIVGHQRPRAAQLVRVGRGDGLSGPATS